MAARTDRFINGKFSARVNPKDGYAISKCKDVRARRVLEFLVPILYLKKLIRVTITIGNTTFHALSEERPIDWRLVMRDIVQRAFAGMGKSKATPIYPYVFHLYYTNEYLLLGKKKAYRIAEAFLKYNLEPEKEDEPKALEDSEGKSLTLKEIRELQAQEPTRLKKSLRNKREFLEAKEPTTQQRASPLIELMEPSYQAVINHMKKIQAREIAQANIIQATCEKLVKCKPEDLVAAINNLPTREKVDELEAKNNFLLEMANKFKTKLDEHKK